MNRSQPWIWRDCMPTNIKTGGGLRSLQIAEIVNALDMPWLDILGRRDKRVLRDVLGDWRLLFAEPGAAGMQARMRRRVANKLVVLEKLAAKLGYPRCLLWENTRDHSLLLFGRRHDIPVIALPHNVESFGSSEQLRFAQGNLHTRFRREMDLFSLAQRVFVISNWDQWLLGLFNVTSEYLPYRLPRARQRSLQSIRAHRESTSTTSGPLIVIGTANYAPNWHGMKTLLLALDKVVGESNLRVVVAGFGTETLGDGLSSRIEIRGSVSEEAMFSLYREARAGIVYQQPATGALTRIPDFLTAGVPVYANTYAARSYSHRSDLTVFEDFDMLAKMLRAQAGKEACYGASISWDGASAGESALRAAILECV